MALAKGAVAFWMTLMALCGVCFGAVHKVGDSAGWTVIDNVDYNKWASTKSFRIGDILVFNYFNQFHNVIQVTHEHYQSCNATSPLASFTSGNDSITLKNSGHHYFICGFPGHCQAGQKVDVLVGPSSRSPRVSPSPIPPSGSPPVRVPSPPSPTHNSAASFSSSEFWMVLGVISFSIALFS